MILSWKNAKSRRVYETGRPKGFKGLDGEMATRRLDILAANERLQDIPRLASIGLHKLRRDREGQWAMTINGPWRVCFVPDEGRGGFRDVEITDHHTG